MSPISNAIVSTVVDLESAWGELKGSPTAKKIAFLSNTFKPNQGLEANEELRGSRTSGKKVPGVKNPGGGLSAHVTDETLPFLWYLALGSIQSSIFLPTTPVAALAAAGAGNVTDGTHSYKIVYTKPGVAGYTSPSAVSNTVTTATGNGKVTLTLADVLPSTWTKKIYRTEAGGAVTGPWKLVGSVAGNVTTYLDNIADASLTTAITGAGTADDYQHIISVGSTLPSAIVQRSIPGTPDRFVQALGAMCNSGKVSIKSTGFYDFVGDFKAKTVQGPKDSVGAWLADYDATPDDWMNGEMLHHAMVLSGAVLVDGVAFGRFSSLDLTHNNNLAADDHPISLGGDLGSIVPLRASTQFSGEMVVNDGADYGLVSDPMTPHAVSLVWKMTGRKYHQIDLPTVQFDPSSSEVSGQGILKLPINGEAYYDSVTQQQLKVTVVNSIAGTSYQP